MRVKPIYGHRAETLHRRARHHPHRSPRRPRAVSGRLGADPVLDDRAQAHCCRRLAEPAEEIDRALGCHDEDRAADLDHERQDLIDELRRATGLIGRSRPLGDEG
jgi:hypothetical protein